MKVLLLNRPDSLTDPGGDTVQMLKTKQYLNIFGVESEISYSLAPDNLSAFDLFHIFNLQTSRSTLAQVMAVKAQKKKIVLSPIFWKIDEDNGLDNILECVIEEVLSEARLNWLRPFRKACYFLGKRLFKPNQKKKYEEQRKILEIVDLLLPNSKTEVEHIENYFLMTGVKEKCCVVPNAAELSLFGHRDAQAAERFKEKYGVEDFILEVGRIDPCKNQLLLIEVLKDIPIPIVLAGKVGKRRKYYYKRCLSAGHKRGRVVFIGDQPHEELRGAYSAAKVHVLPSWRETPGLANLEAAMVGCNIVSTIHGSAMEYFGDRAFYCNPGDPMSVRKAVLAAYSAPFDPLTSEFLRENFSWERTAQQTLKAYEEVLSR